MGKESARHEFSRINEHIDTVSCLQCDHVITDAGKDSFTYRNPTKLLHAKEPKRGRPGQYDWDSDDDSNSEDSEDFEAKQEALLMKKYIDRKTGKVNLDLIWPYVPNEDEVTESVWV